MIRKILLNVLIINSTLCKPSGKDKYLYSATFLSNCQMLKNLEINDSVDILKNKLSVSDCKSGAQKIYKLSKLNLSQEKLKSLIPIENLINLKELKINITNLKKIDKSINSLVNLESLYLEGQSSNLFSLSALENHKNLSKIEFDKKKILIDKDKCPKNAISVPIRSICNDL